MLALLALTLALALPTTLESPAAWLARQLARAFEPAAIDQLALPRLGPWLALTIVSLAGIVVLHSASRSSRPLTPAIDARRARISIGMRIALTGLGSILALWLLAPAVAAAARSVDASATSLASFWSFWLRRCLLVVAASAGLLGLLEWLASARQLWLALHLTPDQSRELRHTGDR